MQQVGTQLAGSGDWSLGFSERTDLLVSMARGLQPPGGLRHGKPRGGGVGI